MLSEITMAKLVINEGRPLAAHANGTIHSQHKVPFAREAGDLN